MTKTKFILIVMFCILFLFGVGCINNHSYADDDMNNTTNTNNISISTDAGTSTNSEGLVPSPNYQNNCEIWEL